MPSRALSGRNGFSVLQITRQTCVGGLLGRMALLLCPFLKSSNQYIFPVLKVFEEAKIPFNWASTTYVPIFDRLYLEKSTTTTLKMVGSQALLVSTKKSMQVLTRCSLGAPWSTLSEQEPGGKEVEEKKEDEKTSKLMWKPQKADPNDLDDN